MKSLEQIYILNNLSNDVWRFATALVDVVERFDRVDEAVGEIEKNFYWSDAVNQLEMWRTLIGNHTQLWEEGLNEIDLTEVNVELLDDCPDNNTLQNRLRIVKNRYCGTWKITKVGESDIIFDRLLHIVDRLTEILYSVYDWSKEDAHNKAIKWHDYLLQKWCNVLELQNYMQSVIDNAENILNPQPDTTTEQEQTVVKLPPELDTPQAHIIWSKAKHNRWVDDNFQFIGTRQQMCFAADEMGKALKLRNRWKPFVTLWNYKFFAQTRQKGELGYEPIDRMNDIKKSFSL